MNDEEKIIVELKKKPLKTEREEKRHKTLKTLLSVLLCILIFVTGVSSGIVGYKILHPTTKTNSATVFDEMAYILKYYYLYGSNDDEFVSKLVDKALHGMSDFEDDPYTAYMSKQELEAFSSSINQDFIGIGVQYTKVNDVGLITKVLADSPAERAGLLAGDIFSFVDGLSIAELTADEIKQLVVGEKGTIVTVTITRDNETFDVHIPRGAVSYTVTGVQEDDFYYLVIESFGQTTGKEIMSYLDENTSRNIIIDVRSNSGGYQTSVQEVSGLFIGNGQVYLKQEDNQGNMKEDRTICSKTYSFDKIAILTNGKTASAAEVFTIALKESLDNVVIIGDTTYGKGVIQNTHMLSNGAALKFTDYYWYSPNGTSIHKTGIKPDIEVKENVLYNEAYISMDEDEVFKKEDVSSQIRLCEICLDVMKYKINHTNGYFDLELENAVKQIQEELGIEITGVLDKTTYEAILSSAIYQVSTDISLDDIYNKALEVIHED